MGAALETVQVFRFGEFALDSRTGELTNGGRRAPLRDQPLELLLALLQRPGDLVTREELIGRLWPPNTFVDFDRGLNKAINHLRRALGDSAEHPQFIETLPRKGYRFLAPVTIEARSADQAARRPRWRSRLTVSAVLVAGVAIVIGAGPGNVPEWMGGRWRVGVVREISALAVLPLEDLSRDPQGEYFADGITDELITDLVKMGSLRVTSRTSVMRYKGTKRSIAEIGRELNVDAVVEGTITRSGSRVRITAQLIQVPTDMHLWAEVYERDMREVLDLQSDVATDIARRVNLVVKPPSLLRLVNPEAYGLYLKGRYSFHQYTSQGWQRAIEYFNQAIGRDPGFAPAYSGLADVYLVAGAYGSIPNDEALTRGKAAAAKALQLDDTLASAHFALATAHTWYDWDWPNADREFRRALELNPNDAMGRNWYGGYLSLRGRHDEAIAEHQRACQLDPLSLIVNANLTRALYWARRYDEAITQARKTLEMDPHFGVALFWLEGALRHRGLFKEAVALRRAVATPEQAQEIGRRFKQAGFDALLRESGETLRKGGTPVAAARCYAQLGQKNEAIALLEACSAQRCSSLVNLAVEPDFDPLRDEPRFQQLVRLVGAR